MNDINSLLIPKQIIRSNRKSISLIVNKSGELIVRAPLFCKDKLIFDFINKKAKWIIAKKSELAKNDKYSPLTFTKEETIYIIGKPYKIVLLPIKRVKLKDDEIFVPNLNPMMSLKNWLIKLAKVHVTNTVAEYSKKYNLKYTSISITSARTRWGSCSYKNHLNFTYRLVMCPQVVIEYIVIHELCHTLEKNHSKQFWNRVESLCPDYKTCEKWLKDNRRIMDVI